MSRHTREHKSWYSVICTWCGKPFTTHRRHALTDTPRCRQALHRNGGGRYQRDIRYLGQGVNRPLGIVHGTAPRLGDSVVRHRAKVAELPPLEPFDDLVARVGLDDLVQVEIEDGTVFTATEEQFQDMRRLCEEESRPGFVHTPINLCITVHEAHEFLGLTQGSLITREMARKRSFNRGTVVARQAFGVLCDYYSWPKPKQR